MGQIPVFTVKILAAISALALLLSGCVDNDAPEVTDDGSEAGNDATPETNDTDSLESQVPPGAWTEQFQGEYTAQRWVACEEVVGNCIIGTGIDIEDPVDHRFSFGNVSLLRLEAEVAWDDELSINGREIRFSCARNCGGFVDYRVSGYDSPLQLNEEWNLPPRAVMEVMFYVAMSPEDLDAGTRFDVEDDVEFSGRVVLQN